MNNNVQKYVNLERESNKCTDIVDEIQIRQSKTMASNCNEDIVKLINQTKKLEKNIAELLSEMNAMKGIRLLLVRNTEQVYYL